MDKVIESFINQCDEMMITEEGLISKIKEKVQSKKKKVVQCSSSLVDIIDKSTEKENFHTLKNNDMDLYIAMHGNNQVIHDNKDNILAQFNNALKNEKSLAKLAYQAYVKDENDSGWEINNLYIDEFDIYEDDGKLSYSVYINDQVNGGNSYRIDNVNNGKANIKDVTYQD